MTTAPTLYDADILEWSERQAALLRRVAAGERVNDSDLDWTNIVEEVESVGREQLHSVASLLSQALLHVLKVQAWPSSMAVPGWRAETRRFCDDAASRFSPSMRQRIDMEKLYRRALRAMPDTIDGQPPFASSSQCSVTLDELLSQP